jgi:hypothetical protein
MTVWRVVEYAAVIGLMIGVLWFAARLLRVPSTRHPELAVVGSPAGRSGRDLQPFAGRAPPSAAHCGGGQTFGAAYSPVNGGCGAAWSTSGTRAIRGTVHSSATNHRKRRCGYSAV